MDLFGTKRDSGRINEDNRVRMSEEFKAFVENKMTDSTFRSSVVGYEDTGILALLEKEFTMYKHAAPTKKGKLTAKKSKVPKFKSISTALKTQDFGKAFTTPQSDRTYVITKGTWGGKSKDKVVKGFTSGTPMDKITTYSKRTRVKHGGSHPTTLPKDERTPSMTKGSSKKGPNKPGYDPYG